MRNVPAKPQRDSNTVRMNANQITATKARPNVIAVTRHASSRSRRIATAPRARNQVPDRKEFPLCHFFRVASAAAEEKICLNTLHFKTPNRHSDCSKLVSLRIPDGEWNQL